MIRRNDFGAFVACLVTIRLSVASDEISRFVVEPEGVVVTTGSPVQLSCAVQPNSTTVRWLLNGSVVASQRPRGIELGNGTLFISAFNEAREHEGVYQCLASGPFGTIVSQEASVESAVLQSNDATETEAEITVIRGNVAVVPCYPPFSRPPADIEFELNGTRLILSDRHLILPSGNLQISDVSHQDRGRYQCIAYNPVLSKRLAASVVQKLTVVEPIANVTPTFIWSSRDFVTVVFGQNLTLECAAEGWPLPELTWEKYGGHLPTGRFSYVLGNLVIYEVQRFDAGTYLCRASNGQGQPPAKVISVEILERPVIEVAPLSQNMTQGSMAQFVCGSRGVPKVTTHWFHNANPLPTTNQFITVRDSTLVLTNVQMSQNGMYQCVVKNGLGMAHASARLIVLESPGTMVFDGEDDDDDSADRLKPDRKQEEDDRGEHIRHRGHLAAPSKPEIVKLSDSSVLVQWTLQEPTGSHVIKGFKLQFKEMLDDGSGLWRTVTDEIPPSLRSHELLRLKSGGVYRFRVGVIFLSNEIKYGPSSNRVTMTAPSAAAAAAGASGSDARFFPALPAPVIVELRPLSESEIFIGWQQLESDQWPFDGFYIYYSPHGESVDYQRKVVKGTSVRHAVLSHLTPGTPYRIRMQSYSVITGHSEFSNTFIKDTMVSSDQGPGGGGGMSGRTGSSAIQSNAFPLENNSNGGNSEIRKNDHWDNAPTDPEWNDYIPGNAGATSAGQLLYVALGVVFGLVALVTIVCIIVCTMKQRKQQQRLTCAKERDKQQEPVIPHPPVDTGTLKFSGATGGGVEVADANGFASTTNHVPSCNGSCSTGSLNPKDASGSTADSLPRTRRHYDGKLCSGNGKMLPELLPPPLLSNNFNPKNNSNSNCCDHASNLNRVIQHNPQRCSNHIYSKLQDPDSSSKSSTASCDHHPSKVNDPAVVSCSNSCNSMHLPALMSMPHAKHLSPDHIPRSYEHQQQQQHLDQVRRSRGSAGGRHQYHQSPLKDSYHGNQGWRREEIPIEEEEEVNSVRDQATNTDLLSSNDLFSVFNDSDCNLYSSLERSSHCSHDAFSPSLPMASLPRASLPRASLPRGSHPRASAAAAASAHRQSFTDDDDDKVPPGFPTVSVCCQGNGYHRNGRDGIYIDNKCNACPQAGYPCRSGPTIVDGYRVDRGAVVPPPPPTDRIIDSRRYNDVTAGQMISYASNAGTVPMQQQQPQQPQQQQQRTHLYHGYNADSGHQKN